MRVIMMNVIMLDVIMPSVVKPRIFDRLSENFWPIDDETDARTQFPGIETVRFEKKKWHRLKKGTGICHFRAIH
jgi:hypothetical protein